MRFGRELSLALLAVTTACGDAGAPDGNQATAAKASKPNPFHEQLMQLSETDRGLTLRRAVQDNGGSCRRIGPNAYQEEYQGMRMWTIRCEGGKDWAVFVGASGRVQARTCEDNARLGLPACRIGEAAAP